MAVNFPLTTFTDSEGSPLSNGYLIIRINTDALSPVGQLCSQLLVRVPLDEDGVIEGTPQFQPNISLMPTGTYYVLRAYTESGQLALGPIIVVVPGGLLGFGQAFGSYFGS